MPRRALPRAEVSIPAEQKTPDADPPDRLPPLFGWSQRDQFVVAALVALVLLLMAGHWIRLSVSGGGRPIEIEHLDPARLDYKLDINRASWIEFVQLEGIGEALAKRIVEEREANGPFETVDDLLRVRGIGAKTLEKLRPWVRVIEPANQADEPPAP